MHVKESWQVSANDVRDVGCYFRISKGRLINSLNAIGNAASKFVRKLSDAAKTLSTSAANFAKIKDFIRVVKRKYKFMNESTAVGLLEKCFDGMHDMKMSSKDMEKNLKTFSDQMRMTPVIYKMICRGIIQERCYIAKCVRKQLHSKCY